MPKSTQNPVVTKTHNNTTFTEDEISQLILMGKTVSKWRGQNISLYYHPTNIDRVISIGITFDGIVRVIGDNASSTWDRAIEAISYGDVYIYQ